jgi:hypothetical protein
MASKLPEPRPGRELTIAGRPARFSYFPVKLGKNDITIKNRLFVTDPWSYIADIIRRSEREHPSLSALHFSNQAQDFYHAALNSRLSAAKPLLSYYCLMNLAKAVVSCKSNVRAISVAGHGIHAFEPSPNAPHKALNEAEVRADASSEGRLNIYAEFFDAICNQKFEKPVSYKMASLLPQVVVGHRAWAGIEGQTERFVSLREVKLMEDEHRGRLWIRFSLYKDEIVWKGLSAEQFLTHCGLSDDFHQVLYEQHGEREIICFDQVLGNAIWPISELGQLLLRFKSKIWSVVTSDFPYRRYYVYVGPSHVDPQIVPQLLSIYLLAFYFGSLVRYHPRFWAELLESEYSPFLNEFYSTFLNQFVFLVASDMGEQEIIRPALV